VGGAQIEGCPRSVSALFLPHVVEITKARVLDHDVEPTDGAAH